MTTSIILQHIDALEHLLVGKRFPPMSPWWREQIDRFYASGRRQFVLRVGRRGGKSSTLCRVAVIEALYGQHEVPPGDVGVVAIVSVTRDEGAQRLRTVKAILDALGVKYRPIDGGVELAHKPVAFKVFAATMAGVAGFTAIAVICDEVSKWRDGESGANPATEVLASVRPTMATQPTARIFLSSSPLGSEDAHAVAFDAGETELQLTAHAPTWVAHPALTEAGTHELEDDERRWRREYAAIPQAAACAAFDADLVAAACSARVPETTHRRCQPVMIIDPTAGSSDCYTYCVAQWWLAPEGRADHKLVFSYVAGIDNAARKGLTSDDMVKRIAAVARAHGVSTIFGDQFERYSLGSAFSALGFRYVVSNWTAPLKERACERVRWWLGDSMLVLPDHLQMKKEMLAFEERIAPSGAMTFRGRQGGRDDYAMLVMLAAAVDQQGPELGGGLPGSPLFEAQRRAHRQHVRDIGDMFVRLGLGSREAEQEFAERQNREMSAAMHASTQPAAVEKTHDDFFGPDGRPRPEIRMQRAKVAPPMPLMGDPVWGRDRIGGGPRTNIYGDGRGSWSTGHRNKY